MFCIALNNLKLDLALNKIYYYHYVLIVMPTSFSPSEEILSMISTSRVSLKKWEYLLYLLQLNIIEKGNSHKPDCYYFTKCEFLFKIIKFSFIMRMTFAYSNYIYIYIYIYIYSLTIVNVTSNNKCIFYGMA